MTFDIDAEGWLRPCLQKPSPNFNDRPVGVEVDLLVIHNISLPAGQFGSSAIFDLFQNTLDCQQPLFAYLQDLRVSAHVVIRRDGVPYQCVSLQKRAWHAGLSSFAGVTECNDYSIGIELEGTDDMAYTAAQYVTLAALTHSLQQAYPLMTAARITGHQHIAPGRKTDPGPAFDWHRYRSMLLKSEA